MRSLTKLIALLISVSVSALLYPAALNSCLNTLLLLIDDASELSIIKLLNVKPLIHAIRLPVALNAVKSPLIDGL